MRTRVLSLVVCGLVVLTGSTRADGDESKVDEYVKALKSKNAAVRKQVAVALGEMGEKAKSAIPALRAALLDADEGVQAAVATALEKVAGTGKGEVDAELKKMRDEAERARREAVTLRDKAVTADIQAKALQARNERLESRIRELETDNAKLLKERTTTKAPANPPPKDVEGTVVEVTRELVRISIGSDAGLEKGHTLDVYRMKPAPVYLGRIRIVDVKATEATCTFVEKPKQPVQKGDFVANEVGPRDKK